jgi:hypothetical protein
MNILEDLKSLKTAKRDLRKFGLLVGFVFAALGTLAWARGRGYYPFLFVPGATLMFVAAAFPLSLKYVYLGWMFLAFVLGFIMSHVILGVLFFLVITPIGLVARLAGKDFLRTKLERNAKSYWIPRERRASAPPHEYERQF